ncbi:MAG: putative outer membrane repeat protein [Kiritimatiellia bacterium]|jgi:predicted outer membrane repeat protein
MRYLSWLLAVGLCACSGTASTDTDDVDSQSEGTDTEGSDTETDLGPCSEPVVLFEQYEGATQDVTSYFESGDYFTLGVPGVLKVCPGTWYARVLLRADIDVVGLGDSPSQTVLSAGWTGTIIDVSGPNVKVTVDNLTIERGDSKDVDHNSGGGGIYCEQQGEISVNNVVFSDNRANDGSAIYVRDCTLIVSKSSFLNNNSEDDGGAITMWRSTGTFDDITVKGNSALDGGGMALFESQVTMSNSTVSENKASNFGGGIWGSASDLTFTDVTVSDNVNDGRDYGGGLIVYGSAELTRVTFEGNTAALGGGVYVYYDSVVHGSSCNFSHNSPQDIYAASESGGQSLAAGNNFSFDCADSKCRVR